MTETVREYGTEKLGQSCCGGDSIGLSIAGETLHHYY